jgi:hypothetical protein
MSGVLDLAGERRVERKVERWGEVKGRELWVIGWEVSLEWSFWSLRRVLGDDGVV